MSVFGAPLTITLTAAGTTEVTGTLPAGTNAVMVVCTMAASAASQFPSYSIGFATPTEQMAGGLNPAYRTTSGTQQGNAQWHNARVGFATQAAVATARDVQVTTFSGTTLGLTKSGTTFADVTCTVYPIVASSTPDLREGTGLTTAGTALTASSLPLTPGALLFVGTSNGSNGGTAVPRLMFGMAVSASSRWGVAIAQDWNTNPSNVVSRVRNDRIAPVYRNVSNLFSYASGQYDVGSMTSDGYTITQNAGTGAEKFAVMAIPGSFALLTGDVRASTGTEDTTGAGITPSSGLFALSAFTTANDTQTDSFSLSLGGGTVAGQRVTSIQNPDNTATPQPTVASTSGAVLQGADASGQTSLANIDAFLADGVRLNWTDADATAGLWAALVSGGAPSGPSAAAIHDYLTLNGLVPFGV
jgi:hypothetical protein